MKTLQEAEAFVVTAHGAQMYGDKPYVYHLKKVVEVLQRFGIEESDILLAAICHDVKEDCETRYFAILSDFCSEKTVSIVDAVSNRELRNRKEKHLDSYPRIAATLDAVVVKLADRIANVESGGKMGMYRKEHPDFIRALCRAKTTYPNQVAQMWMHLDRLIDLWS